MARQGGRFKLRRLSVPNKGDDDNGEGAKKLCVYVQATSTRIEENTSFRW